MPTALTPEQANELRTLHASGWSFIQLANRYHVDPRTAINYVKQKQKHVLGGQKKLTSEQINEIIRWRMDGKTYREIHVGLGFSPPCVAKYAKGVRP